MRPLLLALLICACCGFAVADDPDASSATTRLEYHAASAYGPWSLLGSAAYDGVLQELDSPTEWGQGAAGYGRRLGSTLAYAGVRNTIGFGLDSVLHQDPRYVRSVESGFWRRMGHAVRGTILTRTDAGKETFSTWRVGSAYAANFISNEWYPDRLNTIKLGFVQGTEQLGFDLLGNLGLEFWPDVRKGLRRGLLRR